MSRVKNWTRGAALLALAGAVTACEPDVKVFGTESPAGGDMFRSYVSIGNSITAGWQSSGINDSTQRRSYARLFADRVGTRFAYPSLATPGCPPPIVNFQTQSRGTGLTSTTCALRSSTGFTDVLNNVGVPGAMAIDPTAATSPFASILTTLFLGGKTQVARALDADPTFASVWIGNNDVLGAAVRGVLVPNAALGSPGVTPLATFQSQFNQITDQLIAAEPDLEGALFGVVQVANAPLLFPVGALLASPAAKAGFDQAAGGATIIEPNCTAAPSTLVSFALATAMRATTNPHPRIISCGPSALAPNTIVGEAFILTPDEQTTLTNTVNAYNAHIQSRATALGWAYVDVNPVLAQLKATGAIPAFPNLASATATFGSYVSLDGVHPSDRGHVLIANAMIDAVNTKYGTTIAAYPTP